MEEPSGQLKPSLRQTFRGQKATIRVALVNPNDHSIELQLTLVSDQLKFLVGTETRTAVRRIPPKGMILETITQLFGVHGFSNAYLRVDVSEGEGAVGFQLVQFEEAETLVGLNALTPTTKGKLFSAQLASGPGVFTSLKLISTSNENRRITMRAVADDGKDLAEPTTFVLLAGRAHFIERDLSEIYDFPDGLVVGSLRIEADGSGLLGDVLFGDSTSLSYATALPLQTRPFTEAVFSQMADTASLFTGLGLYNPGSGTAKVTIEVYSALGILTGTGNIELGPGTRTAEMVSELVPAAAGQEGGYIVVQSTQPLVTQQLFGAFDQSFLSAVPPMVRKRTED